MERPVHRPAACVHARPRGANLKVHGSDTTEPDAFVTSIVLM